MPAGDRRNSLAEPRKSFGLCCFDPDNQAIVGPGGGTAWPRWQRSERGRICPELAAQPSDLVYHRIPVTACIVEAGAYAAGDAIHQVQLQTPPTAGRAPEGRPITTPIGWLTTEQHHLLEAAVDRQEQPAVVGTDLKSARWWAGPLQRGDGAVDQGTAAVEIVDLNSVVLLDQKPRFSPSTRSKAAHFSESHTRSRSLQPVFQTQLTARGIGGFRGDFLTTPQLNTLSPLF
jgi:hypothetical protein